MKFLKFAALFIGVSSTGLSASVKSVQFNPETGVIAVDVVYGGGCKEHKFTLKSNGCFESSPVQCTMDLVQTAGGDDGCEALINKTVEFKAADFGLTDEYYKDATITIVSDDKSSASFENVTKPVAKQPTVEKISCVQKSGRFVEFIPAYGEVHFVDANGEEVADHHDGIRFDTVVFETYPAKISTKLFDEGEMVGGWTYTDGAKTFTAKYRGQILTACRRI